MDETDPQAELAVIATALRTAESGREVDEAWSSVVKLQDWVRQVVALQRTPTVSAGPPPPRPAAWRRVLFRLAQVGLRG